jgi:hypothetical protein
MPERVLPRDFETPPEYILPLSNAELQELGTFAAIWSQVDWLLMMIISRIAKMDGATAQTFMEHTTTGPRVGLLTKLCQADPNDAIKKQIKKLYDKNGGLIEDRNHIVHGLWAVHWDHSTGRTEAACNYRRGGRPHIRVGKLVTLSNRAAKFSNGLGALLWHFIPDVPRGEAPNQFFFGEGTPEGYAPPPWPPEPSQ